MFKRIRKEGGFTLVELLVVLAILAILIAVVVPNLTGFLGRGKESSFEADKDTIQAAVDAYYTGSPTANHWPTNGGGIGASPVNYIDFSDLTSYRYLESVPNSASATYHSGQGATVTGSYGWYVDAQGLVKAGNTDLTEGYNGNYP